MQPQRIILSDSAFIGNADSWDSYTQNGTGETVTNEITSGAGRPYAGLHCLHTAIAYGASGTPRQGRTSEFVAINPAAAGTGGIFAKIASGSAPKIRVLVKCYDSGQVYISDLEVSALGVATSSYADYGATINATGGAAPAWPASTAYAKLWFYEQATSAAQDGGIYWDGAYITNGGSNLLADPGLGDGPSGANTWICNSPPATIRGYRPRVNVAQALTSGNVLYADQLGASSNTIVLPWTEESPLSFQDLMGGFNHVTRAQDSGTQSLHNMFHNVAIGGLNDLYLYRGSDKATVRLLGQSLDFAPLPKDDSKYVGNLPMRVQYAS